MITFVGGGGQKPWVNEQLFVHVENDGPEGRQLGIYEVIISIMDYRSIKHKLLAVIFGHEMRTRNIMLILST